MPSTVTQDISLVIFATSAELASEVVPDGFMPLPDLVITVLAGSATEGDELRMRMYAAPAGYAGVIPATFLELGTAVGQTQFDLSLTAVPH